MQEENYGSDFFLLQKSENNKIFINFLRIPFIIIKKYSNYSTFYHNLKHFWSNCQSRISNIYISIEILCLHYETWWIYLLQTILANQSYHMQKFWNLYKLLRAFKCEKVYCSLSNLFNNIYMNSSINFDIGSSEDRNRHNNKSNYLLWNQTAKTDISLSNALYSAWSMFSELLYPSYYLFRWYTSRHILISRINIKKMSEYPIPN